MGALFLCVVCLRCPPLENLPRLTREVSDVVGVRFLGFDCASDVPFCFWKVSPDPSPQTQAASVGHSGGPFSVFFVFPLSLSGRSPLWIVVACASSLVFVFIISLRGSLLFVISRRVSGPALSLLRSIGGVTSREETPAKSVESSGCFVHCLVCVCVCVMEAEGGRDKRGPRPEGTEVLSPRVRGVGGVQSGHPRGCPLTNLRTFRLDQSQLCWWIGSAGRSTRAGTLSPPRTLYCTFSQIVLVIVLLE